MFPINNAENLEKLNKLVSLENQVKAVRFQDRLGEQNHLQNVEKLYEPLSDTIKYTSENSTKTITETYIHNNKAIENFNENFLELMNDKCVIAPYFAFSIVILYKPENKSQFRLIKDFNSTKMKSFLMNGGIPVTPIGKILTFRVSI